MIEFLLQCKDNLFLWVENYGNISMAILLILEFIGFPVPGEPLMTFLGFTTMRNQESVVVAIIYCVVGTNIGSIIAYYIGLWLGEPFLKKFGKYFFIDEAKIKKTKEIMEKYEIALLLFSRYVPGVRHVVPYLCGITGLRFGKFNLYSFIGSVVWCSSFVLTGYILGEQWKKFGELFEKYALILVIVVIGIFTLYKVYKMIRKKVEKG